jgi:hypothetical protein
MPGIVNTELAQGLHQARGVKNIDPTDVANAIVEVLKVPRFDVYVPRSSGPLVAFASMLPRRAREALAHALKADQVAVAVDAGKRTAYESRAAASAPGTAPEPPVKKAA